MSTRHAGTAISTDRAKRPPLARPRHRARLRLAGVLAALCVSALGACSSVTYEPTALPTKVTPKPSPSTSGTPAPACSNATQSYDPLGSIPTRSEISDAKVNKILKRGYLIVGVSADTYLFGARDPFTSQITGFDIDMAKAVATSLFGSPKLQPRVITAAERFPLLQDGSLDMVARNMTMTCDRWTKIGFSAEYYRAGQKVLISKSLLKTNKDAASWGLADLTGKRVCAPTGTTSLTKLQSVEGPIPVTASNHTGCLVLLQQGKVDAITGDDIVLAGLAAQDPNTLITSAKAITVEPYGLGFNKDDVYLIRYVNRALADLVADGQWKAIYNRWLAERIGPAPAPPTPVYGR
ncbi:amino acid ABC transporter substrate-binding protein (PAAT family) [Humibacillus xanthopallidus]|uniref:Amino acid ABC transporter substrate-binding protein (PAAT family) n=1 Tax=Humibacillus xanthopallidus TaxID=412689 RepID=A0A543PMJ8_9MICO|nr:glutamate ABC transporter substrate-binding protein [Humibacillus xanthopallidus]TQN45301.1 amino acid ABC transporter substrate-binding protein (PAAT family) [Humibacillus xanthopallidus]